MCIIDYIFICMYMKFLCYICFEIYVYNIYDEKKILWRFKIVIRGLYEL